MAESMSKRDFLQDDYSENCLNCAHAALKSSFVAISLPFPKPQKKGGEVNLKSDKYCTSKWPFFVSFWLNFDRFEQKSKESENWHESWPKLNQILTLKCVQKWQQGRKNGKKCISALNIVFQNSKKLKIQMLFMSFQCPKLQTKVIFIFFLFVFSVVYLTFSGIYEAKSENSRKDFLTLKNVPNEDEWVFSLKRAVIELMSVE